MRILILVHGIFPGFVAPVGKEYAKHLTNLGYEAAVAVVGEKRPDVAAEPFRFPVHCVEENGVVGIYRSLKAIIADYDIVHYFPSKKLELLPLFTPETKYLFNRLSVSVTGNRYKDGLINQIKKIQPVFADHMAFTDKPLADALKPFIPRPISILPVGYPADLFFPCAPYQEREQRILMYHGAVRPQRELDKMIEVLARLPDRYVLKIIGGGTAGDEAYKQVLADLAEQLGCADRLILTNMPQSGIRAEIEQAYLGLSYVPTWECYQDQFVLKTLEYLACQRPVITTATRYSRRFSEELGEGRILLTDGSVEDMVSKIEGSEAYVKGFYNPDRLQQMKAKLDTMSSAYVTEHVLIPLYRRVLSE